jgi:hypothetical protein
MDSNNTKYNWSTRQQIDPQLYPNIPSLAIILSSVDIFLLCICPVKYRHMLYRVPYLTCEYKYMYM